MPGRRRILFLLGFIIATGLLWWRLERAGSGTLLADGRKVSLLKTTYGTNHIFIEGPVWAKLARPFVSRSRAYQLGLRVYQQPTPTPVLILWTDWRFRSAATNAARFASVRDENGLESEPAAAIIEASYPKAGRALVAWRFDNFPRRETFTLRLYEREPSYRPLLVGEMSIPSPSPAPAIRPPDAITRQTNGPLDFRLVSLRTGEPPPPALTNRYNFVARPTMAWFEVRENGQPSANWTIRNLQVRGLTDNRFWLGQIQVEETEGLIGVAFTDVFWPDEPAWRMTAEFARSRDFPTNRLWTIRNLPSTLQQPPFVTNVQATLHGVLVDKVGVRTPARVMPVRNRGYRRNTDVSLVYTSFVPDLRMDLARAVDNQGRDLRFGHGTDQWVGRYVSGLGLLTNSASVDLTFAIHDVIRAEFLARPTYVHESGSK